MINKQSAGLSFVGAAWLALFGVGAIRAEPEGNPSSAAFRGYYQAEGAYTFADPEHGSKFLNRLEFEGQGKFNENVRWKLSGGIAYDAIFDLNDFYPREVRDNRRFNFIARENYLDISTGDFDWRLGRQQVVWGEVPGLFLADVVSAKDLREFLLPDFDLLRIPQWAVRGEYSKGNFHGEAIWVPVMSYDEIGKPGGEFYPYPLPPPPGYAVAIQNEQFPARNLSNGAYGGRVGYLAGGWDVALFGYDAPDASPVFKRQIVTSPAPTFVYTPGHGRVRQFGLTLTKDFGGGVFKFEGVATHGREFSVTRLDDADGLVRQSTIDYLVGLDLPFEDESRLNLQFYQRVYRNHDPDIIPEAHESGVTFLLSTKIGSTIEPQILLVRSLNRNEYMARPKVTWTPAGDWRVALGADCFGGPPISLFGQFRNKDRVYLEVRRSF